MMKSNAYIVSILLGIVCTIFLGGCTEENSSVEDELYVDVEEVMNHNTEEVQKIFFMLPSPIETVSLLQKAGAEYNASILNPIENVSKYEIASAKAINLGIYGSDLSYASVFDQTQEVMFYISNCKKLADGLGLTKAFDTEIMDRIEENINEKDSLLNLISEIYWLADGYLQENDRSNLSALIISGGWIEGLHIAIKLVNNNPTEELIGRVAEQKLSLEHLLQIIKTYKGRDDVDLIYKELTSIKDIFDKMEVVEGGSSGIKDKDGNVVASAKTYKLSKELLQELSETVNTIRTRYIQ